jgi:Fe-S-cluster-containing hydrogenase component 2
MVKQVMPPAVLEARPNDVALPTHLLARLAPFSQCKTAVSLDRYPGSCRLRFFRAGEAVCVYREPGWSAFCFVPAADIAALRDHAVNVLAEGPARQRQLAEAVRNLADKGGRELEKQLAALAQLTEELATLPEARRRFDAWLNQRAREAAVGDQARVAAADLPILIEQARRRLGAGPAAMLDELPGAAPARQRELADLLEPSAPELARCAHALTADAGGERVAVARLPRVRVEQPRAARGWLPALRRWLGGARRTPATLPGDGPRDFDFYSRLHSLYAGELVGEISCLNRTPRSATITMTRDGFVVELMRNVLDMLGRDPAYQGRLEAEQRKRLVNSALRELPLFADLPEAELARIGEAMEFLPFKPGSLVCDEHEEGDSLYVIGNGMVKVVRGVSWLLPPDAPVEAAAVRAELAVPDSRYAPARELAAHLLEEAGANIVTALNRVIARPSWRTAPAVRAVAAGEQLVPRLWRQLAAPEWAGTAGLVRCNRLLVQTVDPVPQVFPPFKPGPLDPDADDAFRPAEFAKTDWKKFCARLAAEDRPEDDPARALWDLLPATAQDHLRQGKTAELPPAAREEIVAGLNEVLRGELLLLSWAGDVSRINDDKVLSRLTSQLAPLLAQPHLWSNFDFHRWGRQLNRLILEALCLQSLAGLPRPSGEPAILSYRSRNEMLGEIALLERQPRTATLVTYNHPQNDPEREVGMVHLFRIGRAMFDEMLTRQPELARRLVELAAARQQGPERPLPPLAGRVDRRLLHTPRGEQLGLVQGQRLMLIDLDRCTRCDECVRACVETHDDGRSRLFLVGDRHAQYLVPVTCRSCLDPVCLIGCPVNSIQRGDNKEILIRDWCIGCGLCSAQCPYGSIQMHDVGLLAESVRGWRFAPAPADESWTRPGFDARAWAEGATPFEDDVVLEETLARLPGHAPRGPVAFRHTFPLLAADFAGEAALVLELAAPDDTARVWLNGKELAAEDKMRQGKRKYRLAPARESVRAGDNLLAVLVPRLRQPALGKTLFSVRLDTEREADSPTVEIKLVTQRAVVCDLCSSLPTGPACVRACPHDAAMRVNVVGVSGR